MQFRDLAAQYGVLKPKIDEAILSVLAGGSYINGPEVKLLEQKLAQYVGVKHCITCANGTDAIQLALMVWEVGAGDAVFVPDFTFFASAEAPALLGATPVFVDVDEATFNLDAEKLEEAIQLVIEGAELVPKAVVAVDLFGLPANYSAIRRVCEKYGLLLLEDGAQGFGGSIEGKMACSFGDISTTSFFPAKPLGCYGDGGAVFTDNDTWANLLRSCAVHGKGSMKYDNIRIGINSRLDTLQAAILLVKFQAFVDQELTAVNQAAVEYGEMLRGLCLTLPQAPDGYCSSWAQYTVQLPQHINREKLQDCLRGKGIDTMVYYPKPMRKQAAFANRSLCFDGCPVSSRLCDRVLSLPMGPYLNHEEMIVVTAELGITLSQLALP